MYQLISYLDGRALVVNDSPAYRAELLADSLETAEKLTLSLNQADCLDRLAARRFEVETAGLELEDGLALRTDRESQDLLRGTFRDLQDGFIVTTVLKAASGWHAVDLASMKPIAQALAAHRHACFGSEEYVEKIIKAAQTNSDLEAIDIAVQFQSAYQSIYSEVMGTA